MKQDENDPQPNYGVASLFLASVLKEFAFLVSDYRYQQEAPTSWCGGREASVAYRGPHTDITVNYELGAGSWVVVYDKQKGRDYGLHLTMQQISPERRQKIKLVGLHGERAIPEIVREYAEFLRCEGSQVLSGNLAIK